MTLGGETTKIKVIDHKKVCNFLFDNIFIYIHIASNN